MGESMVLTSKEEAILQAIKVPSENDPNRPEFPPDSPKFPATPTIPFEVRGFQDVWIKDESLNPTGTHKDRMAWEIVVTYRDFLIAKRFGQLSGKLPHLSLITNGTAGIAVQTMLTKYRLPNLKALVDASLDKKMVKALRQLGCEVYVTDLYRRSFDWRDILSLTHNFEGFDVTSNIGLDPTIRFYDWMSYEIINNSPDYIFVPFGTGNLYENILNINKKEISSMVHDPRFKGDAKRLRHCNFIGATTNNSKSKADKLFSPHLPFLHYDEQWIRFYRSAGFCGPYSDVHIVREDLLDKAMESAESQGVKCEPSGIAGLAMMLQMKDTLPRRGKYLIVNTGKTKILSND